MTYNVFSGTLNPTHCVYVCVYYSKNLWMFIEQAEYF